MLQNSEEMCDIKKYGFRNKLTNFHITKIIVIYYKTNVKPYKQTYKQIKTYLYIIVCAVYVTKNRLCGRNIWCQLLCSSKLPPKCL